MTVCALHNSGQLLSCVFSQIPFPSSGGFVFLSGMLLLCKHSGGMTEFNPVSLGEFDAVNLYTNNSGIVTVSNPVLCVHTIWDSQNSMD